MDETLRKLGFAESAPGRFACRCGQCILIYQTSSGWLYVNGAQLVEIDSISHLEQLFTAMKMEPMQ